MLECTGFNECAGFTRYAIAFGVSAPSASGPWSPASSGQSARSPGASSIAPGAADDPLQPGVSRPCLLFIRTKEAFTVEMEDVTWRFCHPSLRLPRDFAKIFCHRSTREEGGYEDQPSLDPFEQVL